MSIDNLVGHSLGQYQMRALLGMGGMGAVYRAYQPGLDREVAVKVLPPALALESGYAARFAREARTIAALEHPHIVAVYDSGVQDGLSYVVMRLLSGGSLKDRLDAIRDDNLPLPAPTEVAALLDQLADALDYAHSRGIIHRDIKPGNVMFDPRGDAFLVDFGIAKLTQASQNLTSDSQMMGTPAYMSPEQWTGQELTPAADQYALAVLAYHLVTGQQPFRADTPYALMHKHLYEEVPAPHIFRADLPAGINLVLQRALAKDASSRYPDVSTFASAFEQAASGHHEGSTLVLFPEISTTPTEPAAEPPPPATLIHQVPDQPPAQRRPLRSSSPTVPPQRTVPAPPPRRRSSRTGLLLLLIAVATATALIALSSDRQQMTGQPLPTLLQFPSEVVPSPAPTTSAIEYYDLGLAASSAGDYTSAVTNFDAALALDPNLADTYYQRGLAYYWSGNLDRAFSDLSSALSLDSGHADAYSARAQIWVDWGDYASAIADLDQVLALRPDDWNVYHIRGVSRHSLEDYPGAIEDFSMALSIDPNVIETYYYRSLAYSASGDPSAAAADLTTALSLDPSRVDILVQRGSVYLYGLGDASSAIADYTAALSLDGSRADIYLARADAYQYSLGDPASAMPDYDAALSLDPNNSYSYVSRGNAYAAQGNYDAAFSDYASALSIDPNYADAYITRGDLHVGLGDAESALADFLAALSINSGLAYPNRRLGDLYYDQGRVTEARNYYRVYLNLAGETAEQYVYDRMAELGG